MSAGIDIKGYFIFGFPGESKKDMEMTFNLAKELKLLSIMYGVEFRTSVFQYRPYHGTQIYHDLEAMKAPLNVKNTAPNEELSDLVGRIQFNFHSGNYSDVDMETVHMYIGRTTNLTDSELFKNIRTVKRPKKQKKL